MNKLIERRIIKILSDGSLNFIHFSSPKQLLVNEKDNKNCSLSKKQTINKTQFKEFLNYKKKYFI
jgi:hypothetical protein